MKKLNIEQMEGMSGGWNAWTCGIAFASYGIALGGLAVATGGIGLAFAAAGYGGSIVGVIAGCTDVFGE